MASHRIYRYLGILGAVLLPAVAVAQLLDLSVFESGTAISSTAVNANFDQVHDKLEDHEAKLASLATTKAVQSCWQTAYLQTGGLSLRPMTDSEITIELPTRSLVHATVEGGRVESLNGGLTDFALRVRANGMVGVGNTRTAAALGPWNASDSRVLDAGTYTYDLSVETNNGSGANFVYGGCWHVSVMPAGL